MEEPCSIFESNRPEPSYLCFVDDKHLTRVPKWMTHHRCVCMISSRYLIILVCKKKVSVFPEFIWKNPSQNCQDMALFFEQRYFIIPAISCKNSIYFIMIRHIKIIFSGNMFLNRQCETAGTYDPKRNIRYFKP